MSLPYCAIVDVERKLDTTVRNTTEARRKIDAASQRWDQTTGRPMRQLRVGTAGAPATYESHNVDRPSGRALPLKVDLNHSHIVPIDADEDVIEVRVGRDEWRDVTDERGDEWVIDNDRGQLRLFRFLISRLRFEDPSERAVRLSYRYGALGGDRNRGGQTALTSSVTDTDTTLAVDSVVGLPTPGAVVAIGEPGGTLEYARVTDIDGSANELTVARGVDQTDADSHDAGAIVHYVPLDVREAVAAKAAVDLLTDDEAQIGVADDAETTDRGEKRDQYNEEWRRAARNYSAVRTI